MYAFRRLGASLAFNMTVPFGRIRNQGAWASDAIWANRFASPERASAVSEMFRKLGD